MERSIIDYFMRNDDIHSEVKYGKEFNRVSEKRYRIHDEFRETLTEEQKERFDKFVNLEIEEFALSNEAYFKLGIKIAVRFMAESMFD